MKKYTPCIIMLIIVTICLSLGIWQLHRLSDKQQLIYNITQKDKLPPIDLDEISDFTDKDFTYNWFKVRGKFLLQKHILLYGRYKDKYIAVSPLLTNKGKILMVARGLISHKQAPIFLQSVSNNQRSQDVEITGIAMEFEHPNKFTPQNNLQSNIWFCLNQKDVKNFLYQYDNNDIVNFYILQKSATPSNPELTPLQTNILAKIQNHHLEYALTWISLAIIAVLVYRYRFYD